MFSVQDAMLIMEEIAPLRYAESWDPTGLQIGNPLAPAKRIAFALDATPEIIRRSLEKRVDLLMVHHPLFFNPLKHINLASPLGRLVEETIRGNLAVYAAHTNFDSAPGGLNDALSACLDLENPVVLASEKEEALHLLFIEIMAGKREALDSAMISPGCRFSWWQALGKETLLGRAFVEENRRAEVDKIFRTIPDILDLRWLPAGRRSVGAGLGRIGTLTSPLSLEDLALKVKKNLGISHVRMVGEGKREIRRLALCSGSGASLVPEALARKADCLLTGDVKYHEAMTALDQGLSIIDAGHFGTEHLAVKLMQKVFEEKLRQRKIEDVQLLGLEGEDPFRIL